MAKGNFAQKKEKKKAKKGTKKFFGNANGKITKEKAMFDNQLIGATTNNISRGY